jgi:molybdopterin/thiamine biosynthesis adenylyltransferase/ubiquitin-protein ligase
MNITDKEIEDILRDNEVFKLNRKLLQSENLEYRNIENGYIGQISIGEALFEIVIGFDKVFPYSVPKIFLIREKNNTLPHIEPDGFVCYIQQEVVVDYFRPKEIIEDALQIVINTIKKGLKSENKDDLIEEFEDYWSRNKKCADENFFSCFTPPNVVSKLYTTHNHLNKKRITLFGTSDDLRHLNNELLALKKSNATVKPVIYIPISNGENLMPLSYDEFWTLQELKNIIWSNIDEVEKVKLDETLVGWEKNKIQYILLGIKSPIGVKLVGIECTNLNSLRDHPLNSEINSVKLSPFHIHRYDESIIKARGTTSNEFSKVLMLGCGSLGSRIASEIMQLGVSELHLVDDDTLMLENIYRHQLDKNSVGLNKANAMSRYLSQRFPFEKFISFDKKIEELVLSKKVDLSEYDLILNATGSPNSSFFLNQYLKDNEIKTPVIYSWNEPFGIGGHNFLIGDQNESCYRCLYEPDGVTNRASFCEPGQKMLRKVAGCSSGFVPFSNLDCLRTCLGCIDLMRSNLKANKIKSWKSDGKSFFSEGLIATPRFELTQSVLDENVKFNKNKSCKICNEII